VGKILLFSLVLFVLFIFGSSIFCLIGDIFIGFISLWGALTQQEQVVIFSCFYCYVIYLSLKYC
jgi:hypothetical protein